MKEQLPLKRLAKVIRSKNAGPFELTLDVLFDDQGHYESVKRSDVLTAERIASLYNRSVDDVIVCVFVDQALGWKLTFKREHAQGSIGERDIFGSQQHAPLLDLMIP